MSTVFDQVGDRVRYKNTTDSDISVDEVQVIGDILGVPQTDIAKGETGTCFISQSHFLPKKSGEAMPQGKKVYWHKTNKHVCLTQDSGNTVAAGVVCVDAKSSDSKVSVILNM